MPFNIGPVELVIILVIALLVIGPGKLPEVGSALGKSIREFRKAATDVQESVRTETTSPASPATPTPTLPVTQVAPVAPAPPVLPAPNTLASEAVPNALTTTSPSDAAPQPRS